MGTFTSATPARVPLSPLNIVVAGGDKKATLTWSAPTNNGGSTITGYAIYRNNVLVTTLSAATLTYVDTNGVTGLTNGTSYYWSVRAVNAIGESVSSNVYCTPYSQIGAPTSVLAVRGNRQVTVSWTAPTNNTGFTLTGYQVERSVNGSTWVVDSMVAASPVTITNLTNGVIYYFRVTAYVNGGRQQAQVDWAL